MVFIGFIPGDFRTDKRHFQKIACRGIDVHQSRTFSGVKEDAVLSEKLEAVPLARIVAGGDDHSTSGMLGSDRHLRSRCRSQAEIDHIRTNLAETGDDRLGKRPSAHPGVSPHHHRSSIQSSECMGKSFRDRLIQPFAIYAPNAGNADH